MTKWIWRTDNHLPILDREQDVSYRYWTDITVSLLYNVNETEEYLEFRESNKRESNKGD